MARTPCSRRVANDRGACASGPPSPNPPAPPPPPPASLQSFASGSGADADAVVDATARAVAAVVPHLAAGDADAAESVVVRLAAIFASKPKFQALNTAPPSWPPSPRP
jgi:hypothetical protein